MKMLTGLKKVVSGLVAVGLVALVGSDANANWYRRGCGPYGVGYVGGFGWGGYGAMGYGYRTFGYSSGFGYRPYYPAFYGPIGYPAYYGYQPMGFRSFYSYSYPNYGFAPLAYGGVWSYGQGLGFNPVFLPNEAKPAVDAEFLPLTKAPHEESALAKALEPESRQVLKPAAVRRVIASSPLDRGMASLEVGNFGLASRELQKAVAAEPKSAKSRWLLAQSLWMTGKYQDAATQARRVLEDPLVDAGALLQASRFLSDTPFWEASLAKLRQAREVFPADKDLVLLEAVALQVHGNAQKANPLWKELAASPHDQFTARRMLARNP